MQRGALPPPAGRSAVDFEDHDPCIGYHQQWDTYQDEGDDSLAPEEVQAGAAGPQRGEGSGHSQPQRGEGLGHSRPQSGE
eukprot:7568335-Pyramimonas_sp.AAC.1